MSAPEETLLSLSLSQYSRPAGGTEWASVITSTKGVLWTEVSNQCSRRKPVKRVRWIAAKGTSPRGSWPGIKWFALAVLALMKTLKGANHNFFAS